MTATGLYYAVHAYAAPLHEELRMPARRRRTRQLQEPAQGQGSRDRYGGRPRHPLSLIGMMR